MSKRNPLIRLHHMLDYAREAVEMAEGTTAEDLIENRQLALALTHLVELVGEAASQVPPDVQSRYSDLPWSKIISTRNRLIHGYEGVDYNILWDTITYDLPLLIQPLERILER